MERPSFSAGLNFHFFTVATAVVSKACWSLRRTRTGSTRPFVFTPISMTTVPRGSASAGRSGNLGSGAEVALGGLMPLVTGWKDPKAGSSEAAEAVEDESDWGLLVWAQPWTGSSSSQVASAISESKRIQ